MEKAKAAADAAVAQGVRFAEAEEARLNAEHKARQAVARKAEAARQAAEAETARLLTDAEA